jgi:predicted HTH domain antitoxin
MTDFISFRSKKELRELAEFLAKLESRKLSDEFREIFRTGIAEKRKRIAVDKYRKGEVSLGKAAEIAGLSVWEMLELLKEQRVELNLEAEDIIQAAEEI